MGSPLENLLQTAVHRRSIREEMNAFILRDLVIIIARSHH